MKKILSYILIALISVNLFAPFSIGVSAKNTLKIEKTVAEAGYAQVDVFQIQRTEKLLSFRIVIERKETDNHHFEYLLTDKTGTTVKRVGQVEASFLIPPPNTNVQLGGEFPWVKSADQSSLDDPQFVRTESLLKIDGLSPSTDYFLNILVDNGTSADGVATLLDKPVSTTAVGEVDNNQTGIGSSQTEDGFVPSCGVGNTWFTHGTILGCVAQIIYYAVFEPTSFLFSLAGKFFDFTFFYSVSDNSYRSPFVVEGWGVVRDFVNIFFIFVLLYVAFATILSLHGFKTKEMIINVVIIGLLINFSLFTTQVIIDTSNILARVFYNSDAIKLKDKNGNIVPTKSDEGIGLSEAIVSKVQPQKLIIQGREKVPVTDKVTGKTSASGTASNIGAGTFILITLLAIAVNVVGFIVFITVGLIFIGRVIGLWVAMIFVPFAFFSYTVPAMQGIDILGWKKWWPETLKLAFLAPIFIFFMYLILKFLNVPDIINTDGKTGVAFVVAVVVPFAIIMVLMNTAKKFAVKFAGEIGGAMTKAGQVAGGFALGAATGGAALAMRGTIGRVSNAITRSDRLNNLAAGKKADGSGPRGTGFGSYLLQKAAVVGKKTTSAGAKGSYDFRQTDAANELSKKTGMNLNKFTNVVGLDTKKGLGGYIGTQERKVAKEEAFAKTLKYDKKQYEEKGDEIHHAEDTLNDYKANPRLDHNSNEYKASVAEQENQIAKLKKEQERIKTGREKEYLETKRKQTGRIITMETKYDDEGNIKQFARYGKVSGKKAAKQMLKEFAEGLAIGGAAVAGIVAAPAVIGAVGAAGVVGVTAAVKAVGATASAIGAAPTIGLAAAVRNVVNYSGFTNRTIGEGVNTKEKPDRYVAPTPSDGHSDSHASGGDDHGGGDHGGGGGHH